eukprot:scaffold157988_cov45-Cyclotella_meneghiniana.AAC.5
MTSQGISSLNLADLDDLGGYLDCLLLFAGGVELELLLSPACCDCTDTAESTLKPLDFLDFVFFVLGGTDCPLFPFPSPPSRGLDVLRDLDVVGLLFSPLND